MLIYKTKDIDIQTYKLSPKLGHEGKIDEYLPWNIIRGHILNGIILEKKHFEIDLQIINSPDYSVSYAPGEEMRYTYQILLVDIMFTFKSFDVCKSVFEIFSDIKYTNNFKDNDKLNDKFPEFLI